MTKADVCRQYREKYGWEMPTLKLARIIYSENNLLFSSVEDARIALRYIEGKAGRKINSKIRTDIPTRPYNPYKLPESDAVPIEPYVLPYYQKVGILSDIHIPYHDISALTAAIEFLISNKVDAILLNGDIIDIHTLSYFEKDPKAKKFSEELKDLIQFIEILKKEITPNIYYKFGNHEERYMRFLNQKAHEIADIEEFDLKNIITSRVDVEIIDSRQICIINSLPYVHGHEFGRGIFSPVNAARGLFLQAKHSAVKGDAHVTSEHTETNVLGKVMTTYSVGCLCYLKPRYLPINKWNHGVAIQHNKSEGHYYFENRRIIDGEII